MKTKTLSVYFGLFAISLGLSGQVFADAAAELDEQSFLRSLPQKPTSQLLKELAISVLIDGKKCDSQMQDTLYEGLLSLVPTYGLIESEVRDWTIGSSNSEDSAAVGLPYLPSVGEDERAFGQLLGFFSPGMDIFFGALSNIDLAYTKLKNRHLGITTQDTVRERLSHWNESMTFTRAEFARTVRMGKETATLCAQSLQKDYDISLELTKRVQRAGNQTQGETVTSSGRSDAPADQNVPASSDAHLTSVSRGALN